MVPWWMMLNAAWAPDEGGGGNENEPDDADDNDDAEVEGLGDAGKRAIQAERERAAKFEKQLKDAEKLRKQLEEKHATKEEKAIAKAREEGKTEALQSANQRILKAEVRYAAAGKLRNPALAWALLEGVRDDLMDDDGEVNNRKLEQEIKKIIKDNPELSAERVPVRTGGDFSGNGTAGNSNFSDAIRRRAGRG